MRRTPNSLSVLWPLAAFVCALAAGSPLLARQARRAGVDADGPDPKVALVIAIQAGGSRYDFNGKGVCTHTPNGSIYDAPAAMWSVRQNGPSTRLNMTVFRLKSGGDMVTLNVTTGNASHSVNTVKVGTNGTPTGRGTVTLKPEGKGGLLTIDATDASGARITGTVKCDAFTAPVEDNGNQ